jgi:plasmid replication initiation protein
MVKLPLAQIDLFIASASDVSPKSHQDLMARNWFSLAKQKRTEPIEHHFNESWVKITGNPEHGIATIFDNDVLIFVIAQYMFAVNNGMPTGRRFQFTGYEFFKFIGRKKFGGKAYADLWASLERLHNTFVETNIRLGDSARKHSFNWLSEIKQTVENGRHRGYEIIIPEWLHNDVVNNKLVLTLDDEYFNIKGGLERWLYLFARKTSGWQTGGWSESLYSIYQKSGSRSSFSEFKRQIGKILGKKYILGYKVEVIDKQRHKGLHFLRDHELIQISSKGRKSKGATRWRKEIE